MVYFFICCFLEIVFVNKDFKLEGIVVGVDVNIILLDEFGIFFKFLIIKSELR